MNELDKKGFCYVVDPDQIEEYRSWSIKRRLQWLFIGNKLRKSMPRKVIDIQEEFRQGKL